MEKALEARRLAPAPKVRRYASLGQRPKKAVRLRSQGLKARFMIRPASSDHATLPLPMKRAFSPLKIVSRFSWGFAPGWYEAGPLALPRRDKSLETAFFHGFIYLTG